MFIHIRLNVHFIVKLAINKIAKTRFIAVIQTDKDKLWGDHLCDNLCFTTT